MMKKFRIEIDGEEFIVNVEEIESGTGGRKAKNSTSTKSSKSSGAAPAPSTKTAKTSSQAVEEPQGEMETASDIGEGAVAAPMPGSILEINVKKGESVSRGDVLIVLEAMKMENEITADRAGTVKDIKVRVGDSVDAEDILLVIE